MSDTKKKAAPDAGPPILIPETGERALIAGSTGEGKTGLALWILARMPQSPIIIYDTKIEPKFDRLPANVVVENFSEIPKHIESGEADYIIFRPPVDDVADPAALDHYLYLHYEKFRGVPAYIDEVYSFHNNGRAGRGLIALMTRGRSRGITVVMCTQKPIWISGFVVSESQRIYLCRLNDKRDRKKFEAVVPDFADLPAPGKHGFYFFKQGTDATVLYKPVELDKGIDTGYIDSVPADASARAIRTLWV